MRAAAGETGRELGGAAAQRDIAYLYRAVKENDIAVRNSDRRGRMSP
jgi:hypothetical protein